MITNVRVSVALGVREVVLCKDQKGKCGLSAFAASKGVFVSFVAKGSPAAIGGLRFGDQILAVSVVSSQTLDTYALL